MGWLGMPEVTALGWSRRANQLIAGSCGTCKAEPAQLARAFG